MTDNPRPTLLDEARRPAPPASQYAGEPARLTKPELEVIDRLADAWNGFAALPQTHPTDREEFSRHLHILQRMVMARLARRLHPDVFGPGKETRRKYQIAAEFHHAGTIGRRQR